MRDSVTTTYALRAPHTCLRLQKGVDSLVDLATQSRVLHRRPLQTCRITSQLHGAHEVSSTARLVSSWRFIFRKTRIKALVEFSRSVHAEMDALISLARSGTKLPAGSNLFTTTYPCHSCARHIVSAGIERPTKVCRPTYIGEFILRVETSRTETEKCCR